VFSAQLGWQQPTCVLGGWADEEPDLLRLPADVKPIDLHKTDPIMSGFVAQQRNFDHQAEVIGKWSGFFPVVLKNKKTGFYFSNTDMGNDIPGVKRQRSTAAYDFNFGGHFLEGASAYYVAAALVVSFNGRAFDPQSGKWLDSKELQKIAGEMEAMGASEKGIAEWLRVASRLSARGLLKECS